jgi:hypothetical protein
LRVYTPESYGTEPQMTSHEPYACSTAPARNAYVEITTYMEKVAAMPAASYCLTTNKIQFVPVRHEEAAAFMACGHAKLTGRLGVCLATSGPGAVHLRADRPLR